MEQDIAGLKCALTALASTDPQQNFSSRGKVGGMKLHVVVKGQWDRHDL